jgi:hypothetical protein
MVYAATHQEKIKWKNDFATAINEAEANDIKHDPDARYGAFTYLHGGHYDGWWLTGKVRALKDFTTSTILISPRLAPWNGYLLVVRNQICRRVVQ